MSQNVFSSDTGVLQIDSTNATYVSEASLRMEEMSGLLHSIRLNAENLPACEEKRAILNTAKIGSNVCMSWAAYFQDAEENSGGNGS